MKGKEYFKMLSETEQKKFKSNCDDFVLVMEQENETFWIFIARSFTWEHSPEGINYWCEIANRKHDTKASD